MSGHKGRPLRKFPSPGRQERNSARPSLQTTSCESAFTSMSTLARPFILIMILIGIITTRGRDECTRQTPSKFFFEDGGSNVVTSAKDGRQISSNNKSTEHVTRSWAGAGGEATQRGSQYVQDESARRANNSDGPHKVNTTNAGLSGGYT